MVCLLGYQLTRSLVKEYMVMSEKGRKTSNVYLWFFFFSELIKKKEPYGHTSSKTKSIFGR
jgi:hypothetical protein